MVGTTLADACETVSRLPWHRSIWLHRFGSTPAGWMTVGRLAWTRHPTINDCNAGYKPDSVVVQPSIWARHCWTSSCGLPGT